MGVSEEPVRIYLFRQNPIFTSLHLRSPFMSYLLRCVAFFKSVFFHPVQKRRSTSFWWHTRPQWARCRVTVILFLRTLTRERMQAGFPTRSNFLHFFATFSQLLLQLFSPATKNTAAGDKKKLGRLSSLLQMKYSSTLILASFLLITMSLLTIKTSHFRKNYHV